MKKFLLSIFCVFCAASVYAVSLNGVEYTIDTLSMYPVGPGTTYYELRFLRADNGKGRMDAFLLAVDTRNPYVHVEQVLGNKEVAIRARKENLIFCGTTLSHFRWALGTNNLTGTQHLLHVHIWIARIHR